MKLVVLESPYAGEVVRNILYARRCMFHSLHIGEAPIASHLLYTQPGILNDDIAIERRLGMEAGWAWYRVAEACVVYMDYGMSNGMTQGISMAKQLGIPVILREIGENLVTA